MSLARYIQAASEHARECLQLASEADVAAVRARIAGKTMPAFLLAVQSGTETVFQILAAEPAKRPKLTALQGPDRGWLLYAAWWHGIRAARILAWSSRHPFEEGCSYRTMTQTAARAHDELLEDLPRAPWWPSTDDCQQPEWGEWPFAWPERRKP